MFSFFLRVRPNTEKCEVVGDWCKERGKGSALWEEKTLTLKKHKENSGSSLFLQQKT